MKCGKVVFPILLVVLAVLGSPTLYAQSVTINPAHITDPTAPLVFNNVPAGAVSQPVNIIVSSPVVTTVVLQAGNNSFILFPAGPVFQTGPDGVAIPIGANASGLGQGTYFGSFIISIAQHFVATVYVSMTVTAASALAAYPPDLFFSAQQAAYQAAPASAPVYITSNGLPLGYSVQTQVQAGDPNWILVDKTTGTTGFNPLTVRVTPYGLAVGTHVGTISVFSTTTNDSATVSIALSIYANSTLSVSPTTTSFVWQIGASAPVAKQFTVSAISSSVAFGARLSPAVSWAVLNPLSGSAGLYQPANLTVTPTPNFAGLTQGTYTTNLIVTPLGGADLPGVPVTLIVTGYSYLQLSTTSLSFLAQFGSAQNPPDQAVAVTGAGGSVGLAVASDAPWLTARVSSNITPAVITVHVNQTNLPVGIVSGKLTVYPTNGDTYTQTIAVTLMVASTSQISVGPSQLLFSYQIGLSPPAAQIVRVRSTDGPVSFVPTAVTGSCGNNWLSAIPSSFTTPATLTIAAQTGAMTEGLCEGIVTLNYNSGSGPATEIVNVTVAISDQSELAVTIPPGFGDEVNQLGAAPYTRQISLTSTNVRTPVSFNAYPSTATGAPWLAVTGNSAGFTPGTLGVQFNPSAAPGLGYYTGNVVISSASLPNGFISIPIEFTVASAATVSVSATSLSFNQARGGSTPSAQILTMTNSGGGIPIFTATIPQITGGNWLSVSPTSGQASGNLVVSVLPNSLAPGDYPAQILLTFQNSATAAIAVAVTLHVSAPPKTLSVSAQSLNFTYQMGGPQPASQKITVTSTGSSTNFQVGVSSIGWLSVDTTTSTTPKDVNVLVNAQGLTVAGSPYAGSVTFTAPGVLANPITVNVTLTVAPPAVPMLATVSNSASGVFGMIAPGELITIKGAGLGPTTPASGTSFSVNAQGAVDSTLAGVRVLFSNIPGTPIYVSAAQINVIVPYEVESHGTVNIVVEYLGVQSALLSVVVADHAPGLFTNNLTGSSQVAAVNENGTLNGPPGGGLSRAQQGSMLLVYGTGFGQTTAHSITGSVTPLPQGPTDLLIVTGVVTATIGGVPAEVMFSGAAPGLVTGIAQINIKVPTGVSGDALPISVSIDGRSTPAVGTTVAVQ